MSNRLTVAHTDPAMQLNRVRGVLHSLVDHPVAGGWAKQALSKWDAVQLYRYLYSVAEACNPNTRAEIGWRTKCMRTAYAQNAKGGGDYILRCKLAATFYLLSEGLYSQPTLPSLT